MEESATKKKSPKSPKKNTSKKTSQLSKEQLQETIKKKIECNRRAQKVVEYLVDAKFTHPTKLIQMTKFINQSHYQDIVEERGIIKICGYPICDGELKSIPAKKYHINTRTNTVYDITERKNFCSNYCYKASNYLKNQILTSPLWLRDIEEVIVIKLLEKPHPQHNIDTLITNETSINKNLDSTVKQLKEIKITEDKENPS